MAACLQLSEARLRGLHHLSANENLTVLGLVCGQNSLRADCDLGYTIENLIVEIMYSLELLNFERAVYQCNCPLEQNKYSHVV